VDDAEQRKWQAVTTGIEPHTVAYMFETSASMGSYQVASALRVRFGHMTATCQWIKH
jgi:hypothetical protein